MPIDFLGNEDDLEPVLLIPESIQNIKYPEHLQIGCYGYIELDELWVHPESHVLTWTAAAIY